ncbi:SDR family NAD(P)-dependent oxidoreductase [Microbacterium sp. Bi121]|uniref:SDR family NAD(P)-dependent oxidoreductase n=1 Tax=Microbacterium sp. Bi121 TaxID=2822348 RepID=UPI001D1D047B|nr:SDR family NAD(P)-dependent oxidoreductase [Microbacterium sp. Bi121]CAH0145192.1 2-dehydro-3-deoxy-L-rhamnonate dehydrogenase (NAD(+)) [Microbacterium sp. Bi121]
MSMNPGTQRGAIVVGASSGMGAAVVRRLVADGIRVAALDLASATWPDDLGATFTGAIDVTDATGVADAITGAATALGGVDIVVNCAGILGPVAATVDTEQETFSRIVNLNLGGAFAVTKAALAHLLPQGSGRIIHIASIAGKEGNPQMAAYSASKAGVIGMVKSVGREYAASGVTVNAIAPASIDTPLIQAMSPERRDVQKSLIPMGRFGTAEEIAGLVAYIASPESSFTTGFVFDASGGRATY